MKRLQSPTGPQLNLPLFAQSPAQLPPHCSKDLALELVRREIQASDALTIDQAADRLGVSKTSVQPMIGRNLLAATQVIRYAPWEIRPEALDSAQVRRAVKAIKRRERFPRTEADNNQDDLFSIS